MTTPLGPNSTENTQRIIDESRAILASLPSPCSERIDRVLELLRIYRDPYEHADRCLVLVRELIEAGDAAIPALCKELPQTTDDARIAVYAWILRRSRDPQAISCLVQSIPNLLEIENQCVCLDPKEQELSLFVGETFPIDIHGTFFGVWHLDSAREELFAALRALTGHDLDDSPLYSIEASQDPRRRAMQRRLFQSHQQCWQERCNLDFSSDTSDCEFLLPKSEVHDFIAKPTSIRPGARLIWERTMEGLIPVCPINEVKTANHTEAVFLDLDTGATYRWPTQFRREESVVDSKEMQTWIAGHRIHLMCATYSGPDGTRSYELRLFGMEGWELPRRDWKFIHQQIASGVLPAGRPVIKFLMPVDPATKVPLQNSYEGFLFRTRDGNVGAIRIRDRDDNPSFPGIHFDVGAIF